MRAIDGDALRNRLQNLGYDDWNQGVTTTWAEAFYACADIVADAPTIEPEQRWIPCSERLPEKDGDYIVTFEKGYASDYGLDPIGIAPFEVDCEGFGFWQENFDMHTLGSLGTDWVDINVIAWMPLPEAFREGES